MLLGEEPGLLVFLVNFRCEKTKFCKLDSPSQWNIKFVSTVRMRPFIVTLPQNLPVSLFSSPFVRLFLSFFFFGLVQVIQLSSVQLNFHNVCVCADLGI